MKQISKGILTADSSSIFLSHKIKQRDKVSDPLIFCPQLHYQWMIVHFVSEKSDSQIIPESLSALKIFQNYQILAPDFLLLSFVLFSIT